MKKLLIFILMLFVAVGIANAALTVSPNPVSITGNVSTTVNGNFSITTNANITGVTFQKSDLVGAIVNISSSAISFNQSTPLDMVNGTTQNIISSVAVPSTAYAGTYTGSVNVTNGSISALLNLSLTVQSVNALSANSTSSITSEAGVSRTATLIITNIGSTNLTNINITGSTIYDEDNDTITLSYSPNNFALSPGSQRTVTITANIDEDVDPDDYTRIISVNDTGTGASASSTLTVKVLPEDVVCSDGEVGELILSIDNPDSNDEFMPGDTVDIEVNVENIADEDLNIYVEAFLYDQDENEVIASVKSDKTKIDEDDDNDFDLSLKIPLDVDEDANRYIIYLKAYERGNEDDQCEQDDVDIDIEKDSDMVLIEKLKTDPSSINCGGTTTVSATLVNTGTDDQENVRIRVKESTLKLDQYSNTFDLDESDDITKTFPVNIPQNVTETIYYIEVTVYDEDGDSFDSGLANLTVSGSCKVVTTTTTSVEKATLFLYEKSYTTGIGKMFNIPVKITNTGEDAELSVELTNIDEWATSSSKNVFLNEGQSTTIYLPVQVKSGIEEGNYSATVNVKSAGKVLKTDSVLVDIKRTGGISFEAFKGINTNSLFWIIGDVILVVIVLLFIRFLFMPRK